MQFDNQKIRNVADVAAKIMAGETVSEELKGKQHKIDKNKNGKLDAQDFEMLRKDKDMDESCGKDHKKEMKEDKKCPVTGEDECKCEEVEQLDEKTPTRQQVKQAIGIARDKRYAGGNYTGAYNTINKINPGLAQHPVVAAELKKQNEEVEKLDEVIVKGFRYGASKPEKHPLDTMRGPTKKELKDIEKEKKVKKPFKEMLELYAEKGLKALSEMTMTEEPDQETFVKELEKAKKKDKGEEKSPDIAKAAVQSVKVEEDFSDDEMISILEDMAITEEELQETIEEASYSAKAARAGKDIGKPGKMFAKIAASAAKRYGSEERGKKVAGAILAKLRKEDVEQIDEREMTDTETQERERLVKGMKKNLKGFKDRYGDRAKSVMYATAAKIAKEKV